MRIIFLLLSTFVLLSCNKEKSAVIMSLKANPSALALDRVITLEASKSTGDITQYGWQLDITSPTSGGVVFSPFSSSHKGSDFVEIRATVANAGIYVFGLTVYDKDKNQDYSTVSVDVK